MESWPGLVPKRWRCSGLASVSFSFAVTVTRSNNTRWPISSLPLQCHTRLNGRGLSVLALRLRAFLAGLLLQLELLLVLGCRLPAHCACAAMAAEGPNNNASLLGFLLV